ncbi:MAG TPA: DUF3142 domain-containing protein [Verrucomicrobiae bacterium]
MRCRSPIFVLGLGLLVGLAVAFWPQAMPRQGGVMPQEVYVWQRAWNEPVKQAVTQAAPEMERFTVLTAEVTWVKGQPKWTRMEPDWAALKASGKPIGLALRIGPYGGPFDRESVPTKKLVELALSTLAQAEAHGVKAAEVQLDFDCAETKLAGYRVWVEALRERVKPVPLTITALPSWLDQREFKELVRVTDGFVLQVHALQRPASVRDEVKLCDPLKALAAVELAAQAGVPFKVALPTYSYVTAFNRESRFIGASAEGPAKEWPSDVITRELAANPQELAMLVRDWTQQRPAMLQGIIWYRLPVSTDRWNWDWPMLAQVKLGKVPEAQWQVVTRSPEPGLVEVLLANAGTTKSAPQQTVRVQWPKGRLVAGDSLSGNELSEPSALMAEFKPQKDTRTIAPGETRLLGWLRFDSSVEVHSELVAK